ncbi:serine/threonine-protein kinase [Uniformispora flossi]|uniref:serine/threonine-protein kinase n=1 Tax=Uniformispora flossi TaxID=3390723 RepID=UPI003C2E63DF
MAEALQPGDPAAIGPFRLTARLGAGGMGQVFLGESASGRRVAVKQVRPEIAQDPGFRKRFRREVDLAMKAGGFWTAPVVAADPDAESPWVASQYVPGPALDEHIAAQGPMDEAAVRRLGAGLAEALDSFHRIGLVHRDLKPSNILLLDDGPRVIDFGISKAMEDGGGSALTSTGMVVGTPGFMSPEQALGTAVGPASDIFSLASVLVFAATGEPPFGHGASHALLFRVVHAPPRLDGVPPGLVTTLAKCLSKASEERPSAHEVGAMLTETPAPAAGQPAAEIDARGIPVDVRTPSPAPGSAPTAPNPHAAGAPAQGTYIAPARRVPPPPPAVAPRIPVTPSAVHEFAVQDGGPAVFRRRIRKSALWAALITAVLCTWTALIGQLLVGVFLSVSAILLGFLPRLVGALPLLVRSSLRIDARVLQMRLGGTAFTVTWQDVALVSVSRTGNTLRLTVVLHSDAKRPVPAPLRRPGADDDREAEFLLISWNDDAATSRAARLHATLAAAAGPAYRPPVRG